MINVILNFKQLNQYLVFELIFPEKIHFKLDSWIKSWGKGQACNHYCPSIGICKVKSLTNLKKMMLFKFKTLCCKRNHIHIKFTRDHILSGTEPKLQLDMAQFILEMIMTFSSQAFMSFLVAFSPLYQIINSTGRLGLVCSYYKGYK